MNTLNVKAALRSLLIPAAVLYCTASCKDNKEIPPVTLNNQIEYNGENPTDIKSVVSEISEEGNATFYLSPTTGINDVDGMVQANDFLCITVTGADGNVDVENEDFSIRYASFEIGSDNIGNAESISLSVTHDPEKSTLKLDLDAKTTDGTTLRASYDGPCTENPEKVVPLDNEFDLNGERSKILSVIEWYNYMSYNTEYHFYINEGITAPEEGVRELMITVADGQSTEVDLASVDSELLSIVCGDFTNEGTTVGTLSLSKDKFSGNIILSLQAESDGNIIKAEYDGPATKGYYSRNVFTVLDEVNTYTADQSQIFLYKDVATNVFAMGLKNDAENPEGLMEERFAVQFSVSSSSFGEEINLPEDAGKCSFKLFDYENYQTWDINMASGQDATGTIYVNEEGDNIFVSFSLEFPDGYFTEGEWYGPATAVSENFDITPVKPFTPHITITSPEGEVLAEWVVGEMELRKENDFLLRGGNPDWGGATFDAYLFYFRPEGNDAPVEDIIEIPQIMFRVDKTPTDGELDLAAATDVNWYLRFQRSELKNTEYSENYTMFGSTYRRCPDDVKINIVKNDDKTWEVSMTLVDYGSYSSYDPTLKEGTRNKIVIEWKGPATKYTGSKKNDLQDSDY